MSKQQEGGGDAPPVEFFLNLTRSPLLTTLPSALERFRVPELYFVRIVHLRNADGSAGDRVVVAVTGRYVYVCALSGGLERAVALTNIEHLLMADVTKKSFLSSTLERHYAVKVHGEHDLYFSCIPNESKNGPYQDPNDFAVVLTEIAEVMDNVLFEVKEPTGLGPNGLAPLVILTPPEGYVDSKMRLVQQRDFMNNVQDHPELVRMHAALKDQVVDADARIADLEAQLAAARKEDPDAVLKKKIDAFTERRKFLAEQQAQQRALERDITKLQNKLVVNSHALREEVEKSEQYLQRAYELDSADSNKEHVSNVELRRAAFKRSKDKVMVRIKNSMVALRQAPRPFPSEAMRVADEEYLDVLVKVDRERNARIQEEKALASLTRDLEDVERALIHARAALREEQKKTPATPAPPVEVVMAKAKPAISLDNDDDDDLLGGGSAPAAVPPAAKAAPAAAVVLDDDDLL